LEQQFDLAISIAVLEHIPEDKLSVVFATMKKYTERGLHGIDFGEKDDGFDRTHLTLKPKAWWRKKFDEAGLQSHHIVDKEVLERGEYSQEYQHGDGKLRLNIGCFKAMVHYGWLNLDIVGELAPYAQAYQYKFQQCDVRNGLPFQTGTVDAICHCHMLEHLDYREGIAFLRECRRVLKPESGVMRIQVPNAEYLMDQYIRGDLSDFDELSETVAQHPTTAAKLWELLSVGHKSCYDAKTMRVVLESAGFIAYPTRFREVNPDIKSPYREGLQTVLKHTTDTLPCLTLYCDAVPKT
jgi:predicted SAM-dependent methyltransferase